MRIVCIYKPIFQPGQLMPICRLRRENTAASDNALQRASGCSVTLKPSARATLTTVAKLGLPSPDSDL